MAHTSVNLGLKVAEEVKRMFPNHSYTEAISLLLEQNKVIKSTVEDLLNETISIDEAKGRIDFLLMKKDCGK